MSMSERLSASAASSRAEKGDRMSSSAATYRCGTCGKTVTSNAVWDGVHVIPEHDPECNGDPSRCGDLCPVPVPCGPAEAVTDV